MEPKDWGERISKKEEYASRWSRAGRGQREIPGCFEEMDGMACQGKDHGRTGIKLMYEGWEAWNKKNRLVNKTMLAGMEKSSRFHEKREALIEKTYNVDEIRQRVLNGDGGSWIREPYDPETIFQLDRFHIYQEIKRKLKEKEAQKAVTELFEAKQIDRMLEYIRIYADSVAGEDETDKRSRDAGKLLEYLSNNKEGLLPWQERGRKIPEAKPGIVYKNMGVQENQNVQLVTLRMSEVRGSGDNLCTGKKTYQTIEGRMVWSLRCRMQEKHKVCGKTRRGREPYAEIGIYPLLERLQQQSRKSSDN